MNRVQETLGVCLALVALCTAIQSHCQSSLTNGLLAYYPFNGNANDESGNGYNPTIVETSLAPDRFGRADNAMYFKGDYSSNRIVIPKIEALGFNSDFSLSLWVALRGGGALV